MMPVTVESSLATVKSSDVGDSGLDVGDNVSPDLPHGYISTLTICTVYQEKSSYPTPLTNVCCHGP